MKSKDKNTFFKNILIAVIGVVLCAAAFFSCTIVSSNLSAAQAKEKDPFYSPTPPPPPPPPTPEEDTDKGPVSPKTGLSFYY